MVGGVEDTPISDIRTACEEREINCSRFITAWEALCDEAETIICQAEEKMTNEH